VQHKYADKFQKPKTQKSARTIPLDPDLLAALKKHKVKQNEQRLKLGALWEGLDLIFPRSDGQPRNMSNLWRECKVIAERAGIDKKITPHLFRHSAATIAIQSGAKMKAVSDYLGHTSTHFTAKVYTHMDMEDRAEVTQILAGKIKSR
jgi:integrase